ncbi:MAG: HAMP domain-containing protein [Actinobacteria bacterium]|uniref:histidine kinase n=1 Tax=freshwater metagenome TaxID=449393 RepID=A0A6J5Z222_9ZZZZ|nr:HAMP domain-containing protein [Actinomycetota bacterium]
MGARRPTSIANRLALLFFAITLGAMVIVYAGVVPRLESSLTSERSDLLSADANRFSGPIQKKLTDGAPVDQLDLAIRAAADKANARVTLIGVGNSGKGTSAFVKSDSDLRSSIGSLAFPAALEAIGSGQVATAVESVSTGRVVEAALPLFSKDPATGKRVLGDVLVFSVPLGDVERNVTLVRNRILLAAVIALAAALAAGYLVALSFGRRVSRLEATARQVADGDLSARFTVDNDDELGRLAGALEAMQTQLSELDSARRRFIATASHELRTPIFSLSGFVELLEDEELDEATRQRFLGQLRDGVSRLEKLTTDLLDLSRIDAGAVELRRESVDLGDLATGVANEFVPALAGHESKLEVRLAAEPVAANCDPERLAQVVRILIDNAVAHTPKGTDVIVATSRRGKRSRVAVTDFGEGIPRGDLDRAFEPFYTSDGTRGAGLGLAIAHELVERMGGSLAVESKPGRTTFALELPS